MTRRLRRQPSIFSWVPKVGIGAWSFVGFVAACVIVVVALAAVSEIVLPMTFAAVLAVVFKPLVRFLERHGFKSTLAAGLIVLGLFALAIAVVVAIVQGVTDQSDEISASVDAAIDNAVESLNVDQASLDKARSALEDAAPMTAGGFVTELVSGVSTLVGLAGGVILGALIMYYLLKDGARLRAAVVSQINPRLQGEVDDFIGDSCRTLRDYGRGRTAMSAIVAVVIGVAALLLGPPACVHHRGSQLRGWLHPIHRCVSWRWVCSHCGPWRRRARSGSDHARRGAGSQSRT